MRKIPIATVACVIATFCVVTAATSAQTFNTIFTFDGTDGANVPSSLIQGMDGNLYGVTESGGAHGNGTVFKISSSGQMTTLYTFCPKAQCRDGRSPIGSLVQLPNGTLYGATVGGGAGGFGSIYALTPSGVLTTLYSFCTLTNCTDGETPRSGLVLAANGLLYGTTSAGGTHRNGTVFQISPAGKLTTLYTMCSQPSCTDGAQPYGTLIQASNGKLYGTTFVGGSLDGGVVFSITPAGSFTTISNFCTQTACPAGFNPYSGLIQGRDGNLYGTTYFGGNCSTCGTVYRISTGGQLTTLYNFCSATGCNDGASPSARLLLATDGNFYGTTSMGGASKFFCIGGSASCGTIFSITPQGTLTTLYSFCSLTLCADGGNPSAGLLQATDGSFYGSTFYEGEANCNGIGCGTIFAVAVGLGPFVEASPGFGKVGSVINILGNNLAGTTSVTFNGVAAAFKVISGSEIKAQVPTGATTGTIQVITPIGTLSSNVAFQVRP
jgi:uncharacterized repeat protein (TIGR03803 family)